MPRKLRQLKADLRQAGAYQTTQRGSHMKWKHAHLPAEVLILSGHDGDDADLYQERQVQRFLRLIAQAEQRGTQ